MFVSCRFYLSKSESTLIVSVQIIFLQSTDPKNPKTHQLIRTYSASDLHQLMMVLCRLVPFLFVSVLQSLEFIKPENKSDELILEDEMELSADEEEEGRIDEGFIALDIKETTAGGRLFAPAVILGKKRYDQLMKSYQCILEVEPTISSETDISDRPLPTNDAVWPAMDSVQGHLRDTVAKVMRAIMPNPITGSEEDGRFSFLEQDPISPPEFLQLMQIQFEENYCIPWHLPPTSSVLTLCKELCSYLTLVGSTFGTAAVQRYLQEPFQSLVMVRSVQGCAFYTFYLI